MSTLRLVGIAIGVIAIAFCFLRLRSYTARRTDIWLVFLFGIILILVGLFPGLVNLPADMISLGNRQGGRLITLLLISNAFLWLLLFYERNKNDSRYLKFDHWVRNATVNEFMADSIQNIQPGSILVLIPAYNEAENLDIVLPRIPRQILDKKVTVLVVDDGSTDQTSVIAKKHGALTAIHQTNRGGGAALKVGYKISKLIRPALIVTMDADGQHNPNEIETLVTPILKDDADFVIGSRIIGSSDKYSWFRLFGVGLYSKMINIILGTHITDCSSGFRAFNLSVLENCLLLQDQYHTAELIIEAAKRNYRINEQPIHIAKRLSGSSKKGKDIKYALAFFRTILKTWIR